MLLKNKSAALNDSNTLLFSAAVKNIDAHNNEIADTVKKVGNILRALLA